MKKTLKHIVAVLVGSFVLAKPAYAHCPLCVAGAGAGLSLSRLLGIDDSITGVWLGALLGAMSFWITNSIKKTLIPFQKTIIYLAVFITTIISFYQFRLINEHNGLIFNLPKLTFGLLAGGGLFYLVDLINIFIKKRNGKVLFPYQSLVLSLSATLLLSLGVYILINFYI